MDNTLLLIDGSSFVFRAFYAVPNLTSPNGAPTGAIYGVINMIKQMQKRFPTSHWCTVFDTTGETFRDKLYPDYKAQRATTPPDLISQLQPIYRLIRAMGIPVIMQSGLEADDIIGSIAVQARDLGYKVIIATGDKDFAQLVNDDITLINTMTNEKLDHEGVINKFGVEPGQIIDYLSLVGDTVDNVPGVPKCGPKTAVKWLTEYATLDNLINNKHAIKGVVGDNLRSSIEWLPTAKILVTIKTDLDLTTILPTSIAELKIGDSNNDELKASYAEFGFKTWLKQTEDMQASIIESTIITPTPNDLTDTFDLFHESNLNLIPTAPKISEAQITHITNKLELKNLVSTLMAAGHTISLLFIADDIQKFTQIKYVFITANNLTHVIDTQDKVIHDLFAHANDTVNNNLQLLAPLFASNLAKITVNYKDMLSQLKTYNLELNNVVGDILLAHYVKNSRVNHSLSSIYQEYLAQTVIDIPSINSKMTKDSFWGGTTDTNTVIQECSRIISMAAQLHQLIESQLDANETNLYHNIEIPIAKILVKIETEGVLLDIVQFKILENELTLQLKTLENNIYQQTNCVFNINSTKQLQEVLFTNLKLPTQGVKKNINGYSTDESTLSLLDEQGIEVARHLLEYRTLNKLLNTYVASLPLLVDKANKVHTTFEQAVVASGRLSSKDPNLQNIPVRNDWGRRIRKCFIAEKNHALICADYSQIELRILAHFSQDEVLIHAFNTNQDIHSITAAEIFHKPISDITKDERRHAKIINFSLIYGKTVYGLSQELKIDRVIAKNYIDAYFAKYPKIKQCLEQFKQNARENGYIRTVFGRKIYMPNINATNKIVREAEERVALNAPMQGTSADIIKIAMCNIDKWLTENKLQSKITLQVHDELILHVPDEEIEIIQNNLARLMTANIELAVRLDVDIKVAHNWDDGH